MFTHFLQINTSLSVSMQNNTAVSGQFNSAEVTGLLALFERCARDVGASVALRAVNGGVYLQVCA